MPSRSRAFLFALASGYAFSVLQILVGFFLAPYTLTFISREAFGLISIGNSLVAYFSIASLGFPNWLMTRLSRGTDVADANTISKYVSSVLFWQYLVTVVAFFIGVAISLNVDRLFEFDRAILDEARLLFILIILTFMLTRFGLVFESILTAYQRIHVINNVRILTLIIRVIAIILFLNLGFGILATMMGIILASMIQYAIIVIAAYRIVDDLDIRFKSFTLDHFGEMFSFSGWLTLQFAATLIIKNTDQIIAGFAVSLESVTVLVLTGRLFILSNGFLEQITRNARPAMGQMLGKRDFEGALRLYHRIFLISTSLALTVTCAIWAGNEPFITAWVGEVNYGGKWLTTAFAFNLIVSVWTIPQISTLTAALKARGQTLIRVVEGVLNIVLSIILGSFFGLVGIIFATALSALLTSFFYLPYLCSQLFDRPYSHFLLDEVVPILRAAILIVPLAIIMQIIGVGIGGFPGAMLASSVVGFGGLVIVWLFILDSDLKQYVTTSILKSRFSTA